MKAPCTSASSIVDVNCRDVVVMSRTIALAKIHHENELRPSLNRAKIACGLAADALIKVREARSGNETPFELSRASAASIDVAMPACIVTEVRSTTAATAMDLVIHPLRAIALHSAFCWAVNQRNTMYEMNAAVPTELRTSKVHGSTPSLRRFYRSPISKG